MTCCILSYRPRTEFYFFPYLNLATLFLARQVRTWVVKCATSLFNLGCSNVAKQVARFWLPVVLKLQSCFVQFLWCSNFCFHPELCRFWTTFSVSLFILSRYGVFLLLNIQHQCHWRNKCTVSPECTSYIGGLGGIAPSEKKLKLDSLKRRILHSLPQTQLIHTSILLSFQFSVSLFINPVRCFQSHFKVKQIASYSTRSHSSSPANQNVFNCAIQL